MGHPSSLTAEFKSDREAKNTFGCFGCCGYFILGTNRCEAVVEHRQTPHRCFLTYGCYFRIVPRFLDVFVHLSRLSHTVGACQRCYRNITREKWSSMSSRALPCERVSAPSGSSGSMCHVYFPKKMKQAMALAASHVLTAEGQAWSSIASVNPGSRATIKWYTNYLCYSRLWR